jgi:hypothetical protein
VLFGIARSQPGNVVSDGRIDVELWLKAGIFAQPGDI